MYRLTTFKSLVVPEGFVTGDLDEDSVVSYLFTLEMYQEALSFLMAIKAVTVPEGYVVAYYRGGSAEPIIIPANKDVPIYLGEQNTDWDGFVEHVNKPDNTIWEILPDEGEETIERIKENASEREEDADAARSTSEELMRLFRGAVEDATQARDLRTALSLMGGVVSSYAEVMENAAREEAEAALEEGDTDRLKRAAEMRDNATSLRVSAMQRLSSVRTELVLSKLMAGEEKADIYAWLVDQYGDKIAEVSEKIEGVGGHWSFSIGRGPGYRATRDGNIVTETNKNALILTRTEGETNTDALAMALLLSNNPDLSLSNFMPESDDYLLGKNNAIPLTELGINDEQLKGAKFREEFAEAATLTEMLGSAYVRTIEPTAAQMSLITDPQVAELFSMSRLLEQYIRRDEADVHVQAVRSVAFTTALDMHFEVQLRQHGAASVNATSDNVAEPMRQMYNLMIERDDKHGHEYLLDETGKARLKELLGVDEVDTERLSSNLESLDFNTSDHTLVRRATAGLGASGELDITAVAAEIRKQQERVRVRKETRAEGWHARLAGMYATEGKYQTQGMDWMRNVLGPDMRFDDYTQAFTDGERYISLGVFDLLGGGALAYDVKSGTAVLSEFQEANLKQAHPELGELTGDSYWKALEHLIRDGAEDSSAAYMENVLRSAPETAELNVSPESQPDNNQKAEARAIEGTLAAMFGTEDSTSKDNYELLSAMDGFLKSKVPEIGEMTPEMQKVIDVATDNILKSLGPNRTLRKRFQESGLIGRMMASRLDTATRAAHSKGRTTFNGSHGAYFEDLQSAAVISGVLKEHGVYGRIDYDENTGDVTWRDSQRRQHVFKHNPGGGAVDGTHIIKDADGLRATPYEFKLSTGGDSVAHLGTHSAFVKSMKSVTDDLGTKNVKMMPTVNISNHLNASRYAKDGVGKKLKSAAISFLRFYIPKLKINRKGPLAVSTQISATTVERDSKLRVRPDPTLGRMVAEQQ